MRNHSNEIIRERELMVIWAHTSLRSVYKVGSHHLYKEAMAKDDVEVIYCCYKNDNNNFSLWSTVRFFFQAIRIKGKRRKSVVHLIDTPYYFFLLRFFSGIKIYRVTDNYGDSSKKKYFLENMFLKKFPVICTQKALAQRYRERGFRVVGYIENGVSSDFIKKVRNVRLKKDSVPDFGIFYVGSIDYRFDVDGFLALANNWRSVDFKIVGSGSRSRDIERCGLDNVVFFGPLHEDEWIPIASTCNFALLPLSPSLANKTRSPMKVFEYFALGLPIIAWNCPYRRRGFLTPKEAQDFIYNGNGSLDMSYLQKECEMYAQENVWKEKYKEYRALIDNLDLIQR